MKHLPEKPEKRKRDSFLKAYKLCKLLGTSFRKRNENIHSHIDSFIDNKCTTIKIVQIAVYGNILAWINDYLQLSILGEKSSAWSAIFQV